MQRRASGIERITDMLFSASALAPLDIGSVEASGSKLSLIFHQMLMNPLSAVRNSRSTWIFPGYPPSPAFRLLRDRTIIYVHDLFLMTRRQDLNLNSRLYSAPSFRRAVAGLRYFFTNSETTKRELLRYVSEDAIVQPYRPRVDNVFGLSARDRTRNSDRLIIGALGTVEPRKNYLAGARISRIVSEILQRPVEYHIIGRPGWGGDYERLSEMPHVTLHGFVGDEQVRGIIDTFDVLLCTSHDEGLGLPLLETQYAGLPVVAPEGEVFREVLGASGIFVRPSEPEQAAATIAAELSRPDWRASAFALSSKNLQRWNAQAEADRGNAIAQLIETRFGHNRC
jgi:glycosyltransferase involved in cell wall biosynthesis